MEIHRHLAQTMQDILSWGLHKIYGGGAGKALEGGIPRNENYRPKEPFFIDGKAKNTPLTPIVPDKLIEKPTKSNSLIERAMDSLSIYNVLSGKLVGRIDTPDGKISPAEFHDQYLENIEGGKNALLKETQTNYTRDKEKLPWEMNPKNRDKRFDVEIREDPLRTLGSYNPITKNIVVGEHEAILTTSKNNITTNDRRASNGLSGTNGKISYGEVLGHEATHGAVIGSLTTIPRELGTTIDTKNPYFYALSEEYKVGAMTFLNKSRQLTGKKLTDPQEIHQLFDEIEKDPSILDKNYGNEESRLPRTYLLLKEKNPEGAELLRNATARDCQYLAQKGQEMSEICKVIGSSKGPEKFSPEIIGCGFQVHDYINEDNENNKISRLNKKLVAPIQEWTRSLNKSKDPRIKPNEVEELGIG